MVFRDCLRGVRLTIFDLEAVGDLVVWMMMMMMMGFLIYRRGVGYQAPLIVDED